MRFFVHHVIETPFLPQTAGFPAAMSALVAPAPDVHFFGFLDQVFTEVGMCYADQSFSLFPGGQALQVHAAVLGAQVVHVCAGVGDDAAVSRVGRSAALQLAGLFYS